MTPLEDALNKIRRTASIIAAVGCDRECRPQRTHWGRRRPAIHTDRCEARTRVVESLRLYVQHFGSGPARLQRHLDEAVHAELTLYRIRVTR